MQTAAVPEQMRSMQQLGMHGQTTDDRRVAEWSGHGVNVTLPSDMKLTLANAAAAIVGAAVKLGREQVQGEMRRVLGIK